MPNDSQSIAGAKDLAARLASTSCNPAAQMLLSLVVLETINLEYMVWSAGHGWCKTGGRECAACLPFTGLVRNA